ncbi:MAG: DUF4411 family protein [Synergistaceae bacterium]|jgi:hypothetical protein|nr:DUF4411 family protein [Synergistaceae bacterium]
MNYVFDTNSFSELKHFYPDVFKSVWTGLDKIVDAGKLISTREVWKELERGDPDQHLNEWLKRKGIGKIFTTPTPEEMLFVQTIFSVPHFHSLLGKTQILNGVPVADPFVISCAKIRQGVVVTEERYKPNAAKIPNVCEHFNIPCINLEQFMQEQAWNF